jgi:hypothetical protein
MCVCGALSPARLGLIIIIARGTEETSVQVSSVPAEARTGYLSNTSPRRYLSGFLEVKDPRFRGKAVGL